MRSHSLVPKRSSFFIDISRQRCAQNWWIALGLSSILRCKNKLMIGAIRAQWFVHRPRQQKRWFPHSKVGNHPLETKRVFETRLMSRLCTDPISPCQPAHRLFPMPPLTEPIGATTWFAPWSILSTTSGCATPSCGLGLLYSNLIRPIASTPVQGERPKIIKGPASLPANTPIPSVIANKLYSAKLPKHKKDTP